MIIAPLVNEDLKHHPNRFLALFPEKVSESEKVDEMVKAGTARLLTKEDTVAARINESWFGVAVVICCMPVASWQV